MTALFFVLPILVIIVLVVGISTYASKSSEKRHSSPQKKKWIVGGYVTVIVVATVLSYTFFPAKKIDSTIMHREEVKKQEDAEIAIINSGMAGKLLEVERVFTDKKTWTFSYNKRDLLIPNNDMQEYSPNVFVISKPVDDNSVEVTHYMSKMIVGGIDFTEEKGSPEILINEETLKIYAPEPVEVTFNKFTEGFAFNQFSESKDMYSLNNLSTHGSEFLLIKVPKSVKVSGAFNYVK
ncbi:hypothetical protein KUV80_16225 [Fictibacillus nanhaiensis]|uniref:hypothetical protein n=1 Tax=Fictibacillus nanhaiensis TaxID=742169 RepID=UPI001C93B330|nr:hypothetical protein [Fictibacillus nanhaiensis]MBY6038208.1 hypothetical protein [Fictibacillus nanhaiensis]